MKAPIILELRGTGILMRTCSIDPLHLTALEELAKAYGEELSMAWFDPAFRWLKEARTLFDKVTEVSVHRGLIVDERSFLEIRQLRKRRRKFTINELLRSNQLFPLVKSSKFHLPTIESDKRIVHEITHGVGCLGRFETDTFNLTELELAVYKLPHQNQEVALLASHAGLAMECMKDDFVVRRCELDLTLIH